MKLFLPGLLLCLALLGCSDSMNTGTDPVVQQAAAADRGAGATVAENACYKCHGPDGKGTAPGIPHLAGQPEQYLLAALAEYAQGERAHAPLTGMVQQLTEADLRNVAAYYSGLPPVATTGAANAMGATPYERGRKRADACARCHGQDGNSAIRGTPSLAGQQPHYLVAAIERRHMTGKNGSTARNRDLVELENLALYFATQKPVQRSHPPRSDVVAGEALTASCGGCHGSDGVTNDAATPNLAGQDFDYLVKAIRSYFSTRGNWGMHRYVSELRDRNIEEIAAFYAAQQPKAAAPVPTSTQELADKCDRCHARNISAKAAVPTLRSQDKDYLIMALRAYRDGRRHSSTMHNMSFTYSNAIIDSLAEWYANQPAN